MTFSVDTSKLTRTILTRALVAAAAVVFLVVASGGTASAYDTGYHYELTRDALLREAFGRDAVEAVQFFNYLDDGYESAKEVMRDETVRTLLLDDDWGNLYGPASLRDASDTHMHFDDLANYTEVSAAWDRLIRNTYSAAKAAEAGNDSLGLLAVLGMSLHQVQDFYAHSNWSDLDWGGDATWLDVPAVLRSRADIYTSGRVPHDTINKDYAGRLGFETAYRESFYATRQWVGLVRSWVAPEFWAGASELDVPGVSLQTSLSKYMSWYTGHWKGSSSKSSDDLAALGPANLLLADRSLIGKWKEYCPVITGAPSAVAPPVAAPYAEREKWLRLQVARVYQTDDDLVWDIDVAGLADFYARVNVNGVWYEEAMHEDDDDAHPSNWITLAPVPDDAESLRVELFIRDEDCTAGGVVPSLRGSDDLCDIAEDLGRVGWFLDGVVSAVPENLVVHTDGFRYGASWYEPDGDGDEAAVDFVIGLTRPARRAETMMAERPPLQLMLTPPATPLVMDGGEWTRDGAGLEVSWTVPGFSAAGPVLEYQYRVREYIPVSTGGAGPVGPGLGGGSYLPGIVEGLPGGIMTTVRDWSSAGTSTSEWIRLALTTGSCYFVDVKALNSCGWSSIGSSDGITADAMGPEVGLASLVQKTVTPVGSSSKEPPYLLPNSLEAELSVAEAGSGLANYLVTVVEEGKKGGPNQPLIPAQKLLLKTDMESSEVVDGVVTLRDLPLRSGRLYRLSIRAMDRAGNLSEATSGTVLVEFLDNTAPPAPEPKVLGKEPVRVTWADVRDSESGIVEYWVGMGSPAATSTSPDLVPWTSVGRETSFEAPGIPSYGWVWVKAVNGVGLETIGQYRYQSLVLGPAKPADPIRVAVGGELLTMDVPPVMDAGRVLVPMRAIFEALGATVAWDPATQTVTGKKGEITVRLRVGEKAGYVRGLSVPLDAPAKLVGGRLVVPLRFIGEALGAKVNWDGTARAVYVE